MNKKFVLGFLLVISVGMLAIPFASAQDFGGGDSSNNDDGGDFDGGDSDTDDDSTYGGGDSTNNDDATAEEDEEETEATTRSRPYTVFDSPQDVEGDLSVSLSEDTIALGDSVTATGQLDIEDNQDREIDILIDNELANTTTTDADGSFEEEITPEQTGNITVAFEVDDLRRQLVVEVTQEAVRIESLTTDGETRAGRTIEVCANVTSAEDAEVTLYHNDEEFDTITGQGEICFEPVLEEGTNTFRVVATADGVSDEQEITRNAGTTDLNGDDPETTAPTGGFLGSPTARVAAVGALIVAIAAATVLFARRRGALRTP